MKKLMIDLDGTMYHGTRMIESAKTFLEDIQQRNIEMIFLTNNAARTQRQAADHMLAMGFENIEPEMFYTSAMAAVDYVKQNYTERRAFMIGELGLKEALLENGFEIVEDDADFVFVGLDRQANYQDYSRAIRQLLQGAILVGTNDDRILPSEAGANVGNGSIVHMMEYCTGKQSLKIGKPSQTILECALNYTGWKKEDVLIVGDNLETDILCAQKAGVASCFVLSGVSNREDIERLHIVPEMIVDELPELIPLLMEEM